MSAYIVEWATATDYAIQSIVGPFADDAAAGVFAEKYEMGHYAEGGAGGYSSYEIISDDSAVLPNEYAARHIENCPIDPETGEDMTDDEVQARVAALRAGGTA